MTKEQMTPNEAAEANLLSNGWSFKPFSNGTSGEVELSAIEYWNESVRCFEAGAEWQEQQFTQLLEAAREACSPHPTEGHLLAARERLSSALKPFEK